MKPDFDAELCLEKIREKDEFTYEHCISVGNIMYSFALYLGNDEKTAELYQKAGFVHDLGKIMVPDDILNKAGVFEKQDFTVMREHVTNGKSLLAKYKNVPAIVFNVTYGHHLSYAGNGGYPDSSVSGMDIPIEARMAAIVDVYDALRMKRPYKGTMSREKALEIMDHTAKLDKKLLESFKTFLRRTSF